MSKSINIKAVIDTVCPWCFVGKRRLEKAISSFNSANPDVSFQVQWLPYQLDPNRTETSNKLEHYRNKFGKERVERMIPQMTLTAKEEGIDMSYGGVISNTFDSHRLIWWANTLGKQNEVLEQVMKLYFEQEKDVGDREELAIAAEKAGLNKSEVLDFFNSLNGVSEVKELLKQNTLRGISGVPFYIFEDKYAISGAQEPDTLVKVFEEILKKSQN